MRNRLQTAALFATLIAGLAGSPATPAHGAELTPEEKQVIGERLAPTVEYARKLTLERGGTVFVVHRFKIKAKKLTGKPIDYQGLVTDFRGPSGVVIHAEADDWAFERKGDQWEVTLRYVIHAETDAKKGSVFAKVKLLERKGFANVVGESKIRHTISLVDGKPSSVDLAADFNGYRVYKKLAVDRRNKLAARGVTGLKLTDQAKMPQLVRANEQVLEQVHEFVKWRRRMFIGKRHLEAASKSADRATAALAKSYLAKLDAKDSELGDLPKVALVGGAGGAVAAGGVSALTEVKKTEPKKTKPGEIEELQPLDQRTEKDEPVDPTRREPDKPPPTTTENTEQPVEVVDDIVTLMKKRETPVPVFTRGMLLDDPNVGYSFSSRFDYAKSTARGEPAFAPALFIAAQAGLTKDFGVELTIPIAYVRLENLERTPDLWYMGNPLFAAKYRFFTPKVAGRRITIVPKLRVALPIQPQQTIPPTQLQASDFVVEAHFVDTYAFLLEKWDFGGGVSSAWDWNILHFGAQLYLDAYIPKGGSADPLSLWAISYGVSVGVRPWDYVGAFLEARGTALLSAGKRHEMFTYLGVKGYLLDYIEPAVWVALPIGSVNDITGFQVGAELRFVYDVESVIVRGKGRSDTEMRFLE